MRPTSSEGFRYPRPRPCASTTYAQAPLKVKHEGEGGGLLSGVMGHISSFSVHCCVSTEGRGAAQGCHVSQKGCLRE